MRDMTTTTGRSGENNSQVKLTDSQIKRMREQRKRGVQGTELARIYGVHRDTVYRICNGKARVS